MIFESKEANSLKVVDAGPFMFFSTGQKGYLLHEAAPVYQNAEKLFDAAQMALTALDKIIDAMQNDGRMKPAPQNYVAQTALLKAIEICK